MATKTRSYVSPVRAAAAAVRRKEVIDAAARFLREEGSIAAFSLEAIAKDAGVTRLTVYNQFGSRQGLLEEVFDALAERGRINRLAGALANADAGQALDRLVEIFCDFWSSDPALGRLQDAGAVDPEFGHAVMQRNERRRLAVRSIVQRVGPALPASAQNDAIDLIFTLTSYAVFRSLSATRSLPDVYALLKRACRDAAQLPPTAS
jgi:AcrR family transcriptional regulator